MDFTPDIRTAATLTQTPAQTSPHLIHIKPLALGAQNLSSPLQLFGYSREVHGSDPSRSTQETRDPQPTPPGLLHSQ